jgi:putrescine transport system ATP-binding protein
VVPEDQQENGIAGTVTDIGYLGTLSVYKVRAGDGLTLTAAVMNEQRRARPIQVNDRVWLSWAPDAGVLLVS